MPHREILFRQVGFAYEGAESLEVLPRWRASGIDYLSVNAGYDVTPWTLAIEAVSKYRHWVRGRSDMIQVERADDIRRAKKEGKLAISFDLEGMNALNGEVLAGLVDNYPTSLPAQVIELKAAEIRRLLGVDVPKAEVERVLTALQFQVKATSDGWTVTTPQTRLDIQAGAADLIEELAREIGRAHV